MNILCIQFIYISTKLDSLIAKMPINNKILQPFGYLHGGATMVFAESVGSCLSFINRNKKKNELVFNIEISVNHIQSIKKGILFAKAKIIHKGKSLHLIKIDIYNEKKNISFCKMTNIVICK
ncbi:PaaI family thioesterase [Blattabacterium cuenoti]|uniref:PaaI family thioesterase n=1 Tax=Blattabacterium cuenoti TaxID=1653831 RepID=UPI00374C8DC1